MNKLVDGSIYNWIIDFKQVKFDTKISTISRFNTILLDY